MKKRKRNFWNLLFFGVGVVGIVVLMVNTDLSEVDWDGVVLRKMPLWLPGCLLIWAGNTLLHTIAFRRIIGGDAGKLSFSHLLRVVVSGFALNDVTPAGLVGGEPYRILELRQSLGTAKAAASTLTFSLMYVLSHVQFWLTGAILYFALGCPGPTAATVTAAVVAALCGGLTLFFLLSRREGRVRAILSHLTGVPWAGRAAKRLLERHGEKLEEIDRDMTAFHARPKDFWLTTALEYGARILEAVEYAFVFRILGEKVSLAYCVLALGCASLIGNALFLIPMQVGGREGGMALALDWIGLEPSIGITASLMTRLRQIVFLMIGVGLLLINKRAAPDRK